MKWQKFADEYSDDEVLELFVEPQAYNDLLSLGHHAVLGWGGTGKTILLRALSARRLFQKTYDGSRPFFGIFVSLHYSGPNPFLEQYNRSPQTGAYEQYLSIQILNELLSSSQLLNKPLAEGILGRVKDHYPELMPKRPLDRYSADAALKELAEVEQNLRLTVLRSQSLASPAKLSLSLDRLVKFLLECSDLARARLGVPLCLLLDGYDAIGKLACVPNTLLNRNLRTRLPVKIAGTDMAGLREHGVDGRVVQLGTDVEVKVVDQAHDDPQFFRLAHAALTKLLEPIRREKNEARVRPKRSGGTKSREPFYAGWETMARISGGNMRQFLTLMEATIERLPGGGEGLVSELFTPRDEASRAAYEEAAGEISRDTYAYWIENRCGPAGLRIKQLAYNLQRKAHEQGVARPGLPRLTFPENLETSIHVQDLRQAVKAMVLQCPPSERKRFELSENHVPEQATLSPLLAPRFRLDPSRFSEIVVDNETLSQLFSTELPDDPERPHPFNAPKPLDRRGLVPRGFLSEPIQKDKSGVPGPSSSSKRLQETVEELAYSIQGKRARFNGRDLLPSSFDLLAGGADYVTSIADFMKLADYVVHDITNIGSHPGVAFELGLSLGYGKRFILLWDLSRSPSFSGGVLPQWIQHEQVERIELATAGKERLKPVLRKWWLLDGGDRTLRASSATGRPAPALSDISGKYVLMWMGAARKAVVTQAENVIEGRSLRPVHVRKYVDDAKDKERLGRLVALVRNASFVLLDATSVAGDSTPFDVSVLAGAAHAIGVPGAVIHDESVSRTAVTMWKGPNQGYVPERLESLADWLEDQVLRAQRRM